MSAELPAFSHVLETILYTKSIEESKQFYTSILALEPFSSSPRGTGFALGNTVLLFFQLGKTCEDLIDDPSKPEERIPKHGPSEHIIDILMDDTQLLRKAHQIGNSLRQHFCLAVESPTDVEMWERRLTEKGVSVIGKKHWERGGYSVYFTDPDGHVGEIASRGLWPNY